MRALVLTGPGEADVQEVAPPVATPGDVVVDVQRAGVCGTDVELFTGEMQYLHEGITTYPVRIGHEWMGTVSAIGDDVDESWLGARVTGDTMLGCGRCRRCLKGYQHVCALRGELGFRDGRPGALAEQVAVPASSLHRLPDTVGDMSGALVEPGGNAFRAFEAAAVSPGERMLIVGAGTIGLLAAMFARAHGVEVHLLESHPRPRAFARSLGFDDAWTDADLPPLPWDAVIDASNAPQSPARAVTLVEPGRRVVFIGLAGSPSMIDTRDLALADVTAVGILSASPGLPGTIEAYATGAVDPTPLVAATVSLEDVPGVLAGERPAGAGPGPKFHVEI
jgi:2-desacetyl-2-hydroxyethyl bacteriochlorophyllide A dehydrogenase